MTNAVPSHPQTMIDNPRSARALGTERTRASAKAISLPITALGGAGSHDDIISLVKRFGVIGAGAGSLFVFKGKYKVAAVRGEKTLAELAQQYDVHPNRIQDWRGRLVGSAERLFERRAGRDNDTEHQVKELHAEIGQLTMERDFLSGKLGHRAARGARP